MRAPDDEALTTGQQTLQYSALAALCESVAGGLAAFGLARAERVAIYLDKRPEFVATAFGATAAGGAFVPLNPLLKPAQVGCLLRGCTVRVLVTCAERLPLLETALAGCHGLRQVVVTGNIGEVPRFEGVSTHRWQDLRDAAPRAGSRV